jgi:hypothetical protein
LTFSLSRPSTGKQQSLEELTRQRVDDWSGRLLLDQ